MYITPQHAYRSSRLIKDIIDILICFSEGSNINYFSTNIRKTGEYSIITIFSPNFKNIIKEKWGESPSEEVKKIYQNFEELFKDIKNPKFE